MNDQDKLIKDNILNLVHHHKNNCDDEFCGLSLHLVRLLVEKAGIELTDEERRLFI
tara:strand:- start:1002 stop:1169 length:168 start_codon:yes stop_codon:yes gene_type:complete